MTYTVKGESCIGEQSYYLAWRKGRSCQAPSGESGYCSAVYSKERDDHIPQCRVKDDGSLLSQRLRLHSPARSKATRVTGQLPAGRNGDGMGQGRCPVSITTARRARSRVHASDAVNLHVFHDAWTRQR